MASGAGPFHETQTIFYKQFHKIESSPYKFRLPLERDCLGLCIFPRKKRAGDGMGGLGGRTTRTPFLAPLRKGWALPRWQRPKGGPQGRAC